MARTGTLTLTIDLTPLRDAFRAIGDALNRAAEIFTPQGKLRRRRRDLGGMGTDARCWPGEWQSTICAGLLCSITPCPSDAHGLRCTCRCHEEEW